MAIPSAMSLQGQVLLIIITLSKLAITSVNIGITSAYNHNGQHHTIVQLKIH